MSSNNSNEVMADAVDFLGVFLYAGRLSPAGGVLVIVIFVYFQV